VSDPAAQIAESGFSWGGVRRAAFAFDMVIGQAAEFIGAALRNANVASDAATRKLERP